MIFSNDLERWWVKESFFTGLRALRFSEGCIAAILMSRRSRDGLLDG